MSGFDPNLIKHNANIFPEKKVGDTIGYFARIVRQEGGMQYVCVMWSEKNCAECKVECPFNTNMSRTKEG